MTKFVIRTKLSPSGHRPDLVGGGRMYHKRSKIQGRMYHKPSSENENPTISEVK